MGRWRDALFRTGHHVNWRDLGRVALVLPLNQRFYRDDHLFVHLRHEVVMLDGEAITLTRMEYRLLALLLERAGEAVHRANILMQLWGAQPETHTRSLAFHMRALRKKLGVYGDHYIETVPGVGYRFRPPPEP